MVNTQTGAAMETAPKVLLMDADGVLQYPVPGWFDELAALGDGPEFVAEIFQAELVALDDSVRLRDCLQPVLDRRGLATPVEQVIAAWTHIEVFPEVLDLVAEVRAEGVITGLATNQHRERGQWMQQNLPYREYFDTEFYSFEMGSAKPQPAYFGHILAALGVEADQVVFVDDRADNIAAAAELGIRTVLCDRLNDPAWLRGQFGAAGFGVG